jgi:hypothetical protein
MAKKKHLLKFVKESHQWKSANFDETMTEQNLRSGIEGLPIDICGPVGVTVVHTNRVDLFFVALDTVRRANVVTEDPGLGSRAGTRKWVKGTAGVEGTTDVAQITIDRVVLLLLLHFFV